MTPYWKGLLKLIVIVYVVWTVGMFFSYLPFYGRSAGVGYGTMIICILIYCKTTKKDEKTEETDKPEKTEEPGEIGARSKEE